MSTIVVFFFQAEDGIRDAALVTGVQTCALPISQRCHWGWARLARWPPPPMSRYAARISDSSIDKRTRMILAVVAIGAYKTLTLPADERYTEIGRASCREGGCQDV